MDWSQIKLFTNLKKSQISGKVKVVDQLKVGVQLKNDKQTCWSALSSKSWGTTIQIWFGRKHMHVEKGNMVHSVCKHRTEQKTTVTVK